jgi:CTP:molybdopterin cytidylyltransferase MocA
MVRAPVSESPQRVAVVLAAGAGSRYQAETHKLLALLRGRTVVSWAIDQALAAGLDRTWVVAGAVDLAAAGVVPPRVTVLSNDRWREGQATSLQVAIAAGREVPDIGCLVVGLGDQPMVAPATWRAVAWSEGGPIAVATYRGRRRNPVRLDRRCWDLLPTTGDEGARVLMRQRPELVVEVAVDGPSDPVDIDTVADLDRAEAGGSL